MIEHAGSLWCCVCDESVTKAQIKKHLTTLGKDALLYEHLPEQSGDPVYFD
jgi:hypothetical protein